MKRFARSLSLVFSILVVAAVSTMASAQSNGLGITPRKDYTIKSGGHVNDALFVNNLSTNQDLYISIKIIDFSAQDESGTPALQFSPNAPQTAWSIKPFIKIGSKVRVAAGKSAYVPISISIPASQGAGSYYSAIEYVAENALTQQRVNITASSATLVFINVPGTATEKLNLKQFGAYVPSAQSNGGYFASWFFTGRPTELAYRFKNDGNVAEKPSGTVILENFFGQRVKVIDNINPKSQLALIDQTRRIEVCLATADQVVKNTTGDNTTMQVCKSPNLLPGKYTAKLALFYGQNGNNTQEITAVATFWYLPWWSIVIVLLVLLAVALVVWIVTRKLAKRRRTSWRG